MNNPQAAVEAFTSFSPLARVVLLPPMVGSMFKYDFNDIWTQLKPKIKPDAQEKSYAALLMVERWAREADEFIRTWHPQEDEEV